MKLKQFLTSKSFLLGMLVVLCVGILIICLAVGRDKGCEFVPEPPATSSPTDSWEENGGAPSASPSEGGNFDVVLPSKEPEPSFPQVSAETEEQTVVDFTDPEPDKPEAPPAPEGKTVQEAPGPEHPVNPNPAVTPPPTPEPSQPSGPQPGDTNSQGQVYDAAFGWVTPSRVEQIPVDSDGDPNKMVGQMGGD